jgi:hypothetical protein
MDPASGLERLFGLVGPADVEAIRRIFGEVNETLAAWAWDFSDSLPGRTGCHLLERSGTTISGYVSHSVDGSGHRIIEFYVALHHTSEAESGEPLWVIESDIHADCQHKEDHGGMDMVYDRTATASTPLEAAAALRVAVDDLARLARTTPVGTWLQRASDPEPPD